MQTYSIYVAGDAAGVSIVTGCTGGVSRGQIVAIIAAKTDSAIITVGTAIQTLGAGLALIIISSIEPESITTDLTAS